MRFSCLWMFRCCSFELWYWVALQVDTSISEEHITLSLGCVGSGTSWVMYALRKKSNNVDPQEGKRIQSSSGLQYSLVMLGKEDYQIKIQKFKKYLKEILSMAYPFKSIKIDSYIKCHIYCCVRIILKWIWKNRI